MLKIKPLNRETSSDDDGPTTIRREAQEEITLDMYNKALRLQSCGEINAAEDILLTLIEENIPQLECQGGLPKTMSTIKYSCYINIGTISMKKKELSMALKYYLTASELDETDVTLWYKIGTLALKLNQFRKASYAFSKGLDCSESHWPCLDQLISVLFALRDTVSCLQYIGKALILDCDYTKGLVLRKNIYDCNPATLDYYKLYNPDYIYEPSLDVQFDEEEESKILEDAQILCDRINEIEEAMGPKPLPCIPLPKPLKEYTWLSLGQTLTDLHDYISENNMSHFCIIDLKKSMSDAGDTIDSTLEKPMFNINESAVVENSKADRKEENKDSANDTGQKMDTEEIVERRLSQNSDTNAAFDAENGTPIQTDIDEMDQDVEDVEENTDSKIEKTKVQNRNKRRRDLVSELQIWGWHSKRKTAKKARMEKDFTIEDALTRIIPSYLLPNGINGNKYTSCEDSMNTMELYKLHVEKEATSLMTPPQSPRCPDNDNYFGSEQEKEDVLKFWVQTWKCCDAVSLIEQYVYSLSELYMYKWPKKLFALFIKAYNMFREHCEHPKVYSSEVTFEQHRRDVRATLLYGELITYNKELYEKNSIHGASLCYLQLISGWEEHWDDEYVSIWCRVHWLRANIFRKENQNFLAINALQLVQEVLVLQEQDLNRNYKLYLPNCAKYGLITLATVEKLLKILEMIDSLSQLEQLYDSQKYTEVAEVLKLTFNISNPPTHGKMGRPAQLAMLLHSLWYIDLEDCFVWTEMCLHESLARYLKPYKDHDKWEMILHKCVCILHEIVKKETVSVLDSLTEEKRSRLVESLVSICCRQINTENSKLPLGTVTPWILLHYVLVREEHRQQAKKIVKHIKKDEEKNAVAKPVEGCTVVENIEEKIPPSVAVLFSGHDFLGNKGWCLTDQGELLHFILDTIIDRLDTPIFEALREKIDIHLEQAFFCLYQHPSKKNKISRHLADHNVNPLPLTWDKAQQVYEFFCPDALPEFDSFKSNSISTELEQLLQRISVLIPAECDPLPLVSKINEFVNSNTDVLPESIDFPQKTRSIYYLLGDYYFKQSEVKRSFKYFLLDLCINPLRLDTWACMALGIASLLESKLTHCGRFKSEGEFLDKAKSAQVCFKQALSLANEHVTLWIEYGSFEYMVHSFCSRVLKYESDTLSMERFEILENKKEAFLTSTRECFLRALELHQPDNCDADERWLYHYMLGKIAEKKQQEPSEYLQHYLTSASLLNENKAMYPDKINYNSPQHLALEVLEVHYRINASILKYLELHEGKPIPSAIGKMFKQCLESSVFPKHVQETKPQNDKTQLQVVSGKETEVKAKIEDKIENRQETKTCENICKEAVVEKKTDKELKSNESETKKVNEILPEVEKCIEDLLSQIEAPKEINKTDVIMIDDSDEDKKFSKEGVDQKNVIDMDGKNVQEIMDAMMKQTMDNQPDIPMDTDSDITPQEVVIPADDKVEVKEPTGVKSDNCRDENIQKSVDETTSTSSSSSDSDSSDSDSDDSSSSSSSSASENNVNISDSEVISLVERCITGLEQCIRRLPQNYKALYRLAHLYFYYNKKKDLSKCRQLFLGEYKCKNSVVVGGLFSDRKTSNFFNGVWRIPSSEIDRPGSLAAHMGRCVSLLLQVLHDTNDHKSLLDLCLQLRRIPDADKIYIRHSEREQFSDQALSMCIQCLRTQIKNMSSNASPGSQKFLFDIFRMYQRSQKNLIHKESVFSSMLVDVYKKYMGDKVPENANVLDLAVKYCQQNRAAEKLKKQQQSQSLLPRSSSLMPAVPVLPTPSTIVPPVNQPLKRPGLGRPRGRPPGPKIPGQVRSARGRNSMLNSNPIWNKPFDPTNYDYMKHYHEELLRQYSQTLSLTQQMNQLSSFLPTKNQNSLLSPMNLLQTMQQFNSGMNPLLNNPLSQNLNQVNPNFMKNMNDMYKIPTSVQSKPQVSQGLTPEQIRLLSTLNHPTNLLSAQMNLASSSQPKTTPMSKMSGPISKPTIVVSKSTAVPKLSSAIPKSISISSFSKSNHSGFKYPSAEFSKPKMKDVTKTTSSYMSKESNKSVIKSVPSQKEMEKTTSILKDRPNISITPVMQPIAASISPPKASAPPMKTLQEKLADKQKQHKNIDFASKPIEKSPFITNKPIDFGIKSNKALEFSVKNIDKPNYSSNVTTKSLDFGKSHEKPFSTISSSSYKTPSFSNLSIPASLNVIPTFSKETGISISQIVPKTVEINLPMNKPKSKSDMQSKLPISLSVIRKPEEKPERKQSSDDDVIIIE